MSGKKRLYYIDNLRIFLISLVVLHHFAITYGAPGGWYYNESEAGFPSVVPLSMFVATNQSFFMGMFFFVSAFFIFPSLNRKGTKKFVADRLVRLGIPTVVFYFLISPFTVFIRMRFIQHDDVSFLGVLQNGWGQGFGPMWFVEALLLFTSGFLLLRGPMSRIRIGFPSTLQVLVAAVVIGLGQFLIRIKWPVGTTHDFTNFQAPFFLQYIFLFPLGIIARQNNWLEKVNVRNSLRWLLFSQVLIFVVFPLMFALGGAVDGNIDVYMGGLTWQCLAYAVWEQVLGFSLIMALLGIFGRYFNAQGKTATLLSDSAYGVYVFHPPVLLGVSALFLPWGTAPFVKFVLLAPVALAACFLVAIVVKQIPGIKKVM